jgi:2,4-dienoyl-CoA reductase-like NADH-dependent reductase (Old Yellow Enzyme family)
MGGAGIVFAEETAVEARGRRTHYCTGIYSARQVRSWSRITRFLKDLGATPAMQLGHAGRRASSRSPYGERGPLEKKHAGIGQPPWRAVSSSPFPYAPGGPEPAALDRAEIGKVIGAWRDAALRSLDAGFDILEIHGAHGYLIHQFLSPLVNRRTDAYGGDLEGRMRFALELTQAVRAAWPEDKPLFFRVSSVDGKGGLWDVDDTVALARALKARGVDVIDCSAEGLAGPSPMPAVPRVPGYNVLYAEHVRKEVDMPTVGLGMITDPAQAEAILREGKADIVGIGLGMMRDPYWPAHAAQALGLEDWTNLLAPTYAARLELAAREQRAWDRDIHHERPFRREKRD